MSGDEQQAIRHPKRGKAHRPSAWVDMSVGYPWASRRVTATACGFGDGGTVRAMTEEIAISKVDPADRCHRCWPTPQAHVTAPLSASGAESDHGGRRDGEGLA